MSRTPAEVLTRLAGGRLAPAERLQLHALAQGFLRWMEAHNRATATIKSYADGLGCFLTFAGRHGVRYPEEANKVLLFDAFYDSLRTTGRAPSTIAHRRTVLIAFWKWLEHEEFADRNIPAKTYPIKTPKRLPVYLEPHQIDAFLARLAQLPSLTGQRDYAMVATFFYSGARVSELAALRLDDVDVTAARIRINLGKGAKDRVLYMPPRLQPILRHYLAEVRPQLLQRPFGRLRQRRPGGTWDVVCYDAGRNRYRPTRTRNRAEAEQRRRELVTQPPPDSPWLFIHASPTNGYRQARAGQPLLTRSIWFIIRRRAKTLLGVKLSPHKLRHTCASYLYFHDAKLETIQRILGHKDLKTTLIYTHLPQKRQEEEIARIFG